jgi:sugar lactone lactonase YvrE
MKSEPKTLITGLVMGEAPRWHNNRLWCTDMGAREVLAIDLAGTSEVVARVPSLGLGFLPDGLLLIVSMRDGLLLRREPDGSLGTHADLTGLDRHPWNDLVLSVPPVLPPVGLAGWVGLVD